MMPPELAELKFSEHEAYYRLGYDSEKEPGVDKIIEGARGEFNSLAPKIEKLKSELKYAQRFATSRDEIARVLLTEKQELQLECDRLKSALKQLKWCGDGKGNYCVTDKQAAIAMKALRGEK